MNETETDAGSGGVVGGLDTEVSVWCAGLEYVVAGEKVWRAGVFGGPRRRVYGARALRVLRTQAAQRALSRFPNPQR